MGGGADHRLLTAGCLANTADKQAAALVAIEPLGRRTTYCLGRALDTRLSLEAG